LRRRVGWRDKLRLNLGRGPERRIVQCREILLHRAARRRRIDLLLPLDAWDRTLTVGVSFDQARIDGEAFAANQPALYAGLYDALEDAPEDITLPEPLIAGTRES
jgi:hypothetical protein